MRAQVFGCALLTVCGALIGAVPAGADPVGTGTFQIQANGSEGCVFGPFDNTTYDVFGTPATLDVVGFCHYSLVGTDAVGTCTSTPDASLLSYDFDIPLMSPGVLPPVGVAEPFVGPITSFSGSLLAPLGSVALTLDGTYTYDGTSLPSTTIAGCPVVGLVNLFHTQVGLNAFQATPTGAGTNVAVSTAPTYTDPATGNPVTANVDITFDNVTSGGTTLVTATSSAAGDLTSNFAVDLGGYRATFIDVSTTATFTDNITICQHYNDSDNDGFVDGSTVPETSLRFLHREGGVYVDRTVSQDTVNNIICAQVTSLSPFVVGVDLATPTPTPTAGPGCPATPVTGCRPAEPGKSLLLLKNNSDDRRDKLLWKWQNQGPQVTGFGNPTTTTDYTLCVYAGSAAATVVIPAGVNWHGLGTDAYIFSDPTGSPNGVQKAKVTGGSGAPSVIPKAQVKGKGTNLPDTLPLPPALPVIVQMVNDSTSVCFSTFYDSGDVIKNDGKQFKAKSSALTPLP